MEKTFYGENFMANEIAVKPGYKTTEFWLTNAAFLLGALLASGLVGDGSALAKLIGLAGSILSTLGYTISRGFAKK